MCLTKLEIKNYELITDAEVVVDNTTFVEAFTIAFGKGESLPKGELISRATFERQQFIEWDVVRFGIDILTPYEISVLGKQYQEKQH